MSKKWANDQKSAPQYGVKRAVAFTLGLPATKTLVSMMITFYVQTAQQKEFWLRMTTATIAAPILRTPQHLAAGDNF